MCWCLFVHVAGLIHDNLRLTCCRVTGATTGSTDAPQQQPESAPAQPPEQSAEQLGDCGVTNTTAGSTDAPQQQPVTAPAQPPIQSAVQLGEARTLQCTATGAAATLNGQGPEGDSRQEAAAQQSNVAEPAHSNPRTAELPDPAQEQLAEPSVATSHHSGKLKGAEGPSVAHSQHTHKSNVVKHQPQNVSTQAAAVLGKRNRTVCVPDDELSD